MAHRGHIEDRGPRSVRIVVTLNNGNVYRETVSRKTKEKALRDANQRLTEILYHDDKGMVVGSGRMQYNDYLDYWIESDASVRLGLRTVDEYKSHIENRIKPELGNHTLIELNPLLINDFYSTVAKTRLDGKPGTISPATLRRLHAVVRGSLRRAVQWRLIQYNPAEHVTLPPIETPNKRVWSEFDLSRFLGFANGHPMYLFIVMLAFTGIRISELCALRWDQIDWGGGSITILRALKRSGKQWVDGKTKNRQVREIPLDPSIMTLLRAHQIAQIEERQSMGANWNPRGLVFITRNGTPINRSNFHNRVWKRLQEDFNKQAIASGQPPLPYLNVHGLRHTFGTIIARTGDIKVGADILGHHSTSFFMDQYVHPDMGDRKRAVQNFANMIGKPSSQNLPKPHSQ